MEGSRVRFPFLHSLLLFPSLLLLYEEIDLYSPSCSVFKFKHNIKEISDTDVTATSHLLSDTACLLFLNCGKGSWSLVSVFLLSLGLCSTACLPVCVNNVFTSVHSRTGKLAAYIGKYESIALSVFLPSLQNKWALYGGWVNENICPHHPSNVYK